MRTSNFTSAKVARDDAREGGQRDESWTTLEEYMAEHDVMAIPHHRKRWGIYRDESRVGEKVTDCGSE
ncbi:MAG: hypothetical protein ACLFWL_00970 [Candidatus Brocadiia bacterium]